MVFASINGALWYPRRGGKTGSSLTIGWISAQAQILKPTVTRAQLPKGHLK